MKYEEALRHVSRPGGPLHGSYLYALSGMTVAQLDLFRDQWAEMTTERRRQVIRQLVELTEASFEVNFDPIFILAMSDEDSVVRTAGIEGLWENEDLRLIAPLTYLLESDESASVRAAAATALGRYVLLGELEKIDKVSAASVEEKLRQVIDNPDEVIEVRRRAVESIAYSSSEEVRRIIREAYHSDDEKMQGSALFAMGRSADPTWRHVLLHELQNENPELRFEAARACGELELTRAVARLGRMALNDPDAEVQQAAVWALGSIGGSEARRILVQCYESDSEALSEAAGDALDEIDMSGEATMIRLYDEAEYDEYDDLEEDEDQDGYEDEDEYDWTDDEDDL
jgi:HEAT repeat protein